MRKWLITNTFTVLEKTKIAKSKEKEVEKQL